MRRINVIFFCLFSVMLPVCAQEDIEQLTKQARQESKSGDYTAASKDFEQALVMAKAKHDVVRELACEEALALVSEHQHRLDLAEQWLMERVATFNRSGMVPLSGLMDLDSFYKRRQMPGKRVETLRSLIALWSASVGRDAIGTGRYQAELGETFNLLQDSASAEQPLCIALAVFEAGGPIYARVTTRVERDLVTSLLAQGKADEAERFQASIIPETHPARTDVTPQLISKQEPEYSEAARKLKISGLVGLHLTIDESGHPQQVQIEWPLGAGLDENAVKAVERWRFRPALKDGAPVSTVANVEVSFKLL